MIKLPNPRIGALAFVAVSTIMFGIFVAPSAHAAAVVSGTASSTTWITDSDTEAVVADPANGLTYIGGNFTYVGPYTGGGVPFTTGGVLLDGYQKIDGQVDAVISDRAGGWYVGGDFQIDGTSFQNLVHIGSDGSLDTNFAPDPDDEVYALALSSDGTTLYIGGDFSNIGGEARSYLASVDPSTGAAGSWDPEPDGDVHSLALNSSTAYAGGDFQNIGATPRAHLAAFAISDGSLTSFDQGTDEEVDALALDSDNHTLYVGGNYETAGGSARSDLSAFDTDDGTLMSWDPEPDGSVNALLLTSGESGGDLYVGGGFGHTGVDTRNHTAEFAITSGVPSSSATAWDPNADGEVDALATTGAGTSIYFGGDFTQIGGAARDHFAVVNATNGSASAFQENTDDVVRAIGISGSTVYTGGQFNSIGGDMRTGLAAIDSATGEATSWNPILGGGEQANAFALSPDGSTLYVGGDFDSVDSTTRGDAAAFDTGDGSLTSWDPEVDGTVFSLAATDSTVYAAGQFHTVNGGTSRPYLASFDTTDGTVTDWMPQPDGEVDSLALTPDGSILYIAGGFDGIDGTADTRHYLASFNTSDGTSRDWNLNASTWPDDYVETIAVSRDGSTLYVGGDFQNIGSTPRANLASYSISDGSVTSWDPEPDSDVYTFAVGTSILYVGGDFQNIGDTARNYLASFNTSDGSLTSWDPEPNDEVDDSAFSDSALYIGGRFFGFSDDDITKPHFASFAITGTDDTPPVDDSDDSSDTTTVTSTHGSSGQSASPSRIAASTASTSGMTVAQLQAELNALLAQLAALTGSASPASAADLAAGTDFTRDLTLGSTGADVTALQQFLIAKGYPIAAGATGYFGTQTQAALAAYQKASGIVPAGGYFGVITRAYVAAH